MPAVPPDVVSTARALLDALRGGAPGRGSVDELIAELSRSIGDATAAESGEALRMLAAGVNTIAPAQAGVAAQVVGAMIEAGHDPAPGRAGMLGALQTTLPVCASLVDVARADVPEPPVEVGEDDVDDWLAEREAQALNAAAARRPSAAQAWQRLQTIWPGAVALLSVDSVARAEARELAPIAERILDVHEAAGWLRALMCVLDDEPYVALEPATGTGVAGRMSGVVENFQLNTLLMDAFPGDRPRVSQAAVAVARGEGPQRIDEQVAGAWNLFTYAALTADGGLPDPTDFAYSDTWIWNEGMPADIPVLDGHRVVLLGPAHMRRSWPAQRMFLKLSAQLTAEPLDADAVARWLARIAQAAAARVTR